MSSRFDRHELIPGWQQARLENACVVIVGAGALGSEVARLLAMVGVGRMILCDPDRVELSNLSRTPLYFEADVGSYKVEAASAALGKLAPSLRVDARPLPLVNGVGLAEIRDATLVLGCLDSRAARVQLAGRCGLVRAPSIDGATDPWGGEVQLFLDPDGPCYACALTPEQRAVADVPWSCLDASRAAPEGAAAPSSALVASWMSLFAVRHLMGLPCPVGTVTINAAQGTSRPVTLARDPECPLHRPLDGVRKITASHLDTVAMLKSESGSEDFPLLWDAAQSGMECPACGYEETRWGRAMVASCPRCGTPVRPRTTLDLQEAPGDTCLASLGVAPREILAIRTCDEINYVELTVEAAVSPKHERPQSWL